MECWKIMLTVENSRALIKYYRIIKYAILYTSTANPMRVKKCVSSKSKQLTETEEYPQR